MTDLTTPEEWIRLKTAQFRQENKSHERPNYIQQKNESD